MTINLLPPEFRERQVARRRTTVVAVVGLVVIVALGLFYLLKQLELSRVERDLAAQRATNSQLQQQVNELASVDQFRAEIDARRQLLSRLLTNEVRWSGVLGDISLVIPSDAWLTSLTGSAPETIASAGSAAATGTGLIGSLSFQGFADRHPTVALWLTQLSEVQGFENPWLSSSTEALIGSTGVVQWTSTVDLSTDAATKRSLP